MKSYVVLVIILFMASCHKEEGREARPTGTLKIDIGLFITVTEVQDNLKSTAGAEDFKVVIYSAAGEEVMSFDRASELPEEIELEIGDYYVAAFSENDLPAAFDNPYYYGESEVFTISPDNQHSVVVTCELANTVVAIVYSENVIDFFTDYSTTVASSAGSLVFVKNETRSGYFRPLPLTITAVVAWQTNEGVTQQKILTGSIPDPQPKKKYEIHIDASPGGGETLLKITLDESEGPVEIVNLTDETNPDDSPIQPGELIITEVMYNPAALSDASGEWFEVYNNSNRILPLQNLVISRDLSEYHTVNLPVILAPHNYYVFARTTEAVPGITYVYGTGITLTNSGSLLSVSTYGNNGTDGITICSVDYGAEGFPDAAGTSVCLDPGLMNPQDAMNGSSWCLSVTAFESGDLGTPGRINDNCQ